NNESTVFQYCSEHLRLAGGQAEYCDLFHCPSSTDDGYKKRPHMAACFGVMTPYRASAES
ncbi:TPA: hypothetical protein ACUAHH_005199, partial [Escherichia coli]